MQSNHPPTHEHLVLRGPKESVIIAFYLNIHHCEVQSQKLELSRGRKNWTKASYLATVNLRISPWICLSLTAVWALVSMFALYSSYQHPTTEDKMWWTFLWRHPVSYCSCAVDFTHFIVLIFCNQPLVGNCCASVTSLKSVGGKILLPENSWENSGNSVRLYFWGLQNHCR